MQTIRHIAQGVRKRCEEYNVISKGTFDNGLCGMCAIASFALKIALKKNGFKSDVIAGCFDSNGNHDWYINSKGKPIQNHCWVITQGKIIDITATQFEVEEPVLIVPWADKRYKEIKIVKNRKTFVQDEWPNYQIPSTEKIQKILQFPINRLTSHGFLI